MKKQLLSFFLTFALAFLAQAGLNPVTQNPWTTNQPSALPAPSIVITNNQPSVSFGFASLGFGTLQFGNWVITNGDSLSDAGGIVTASSFIGPGDNLTNSTTTLPSNTNSLVSAAQAAIIASASGGGVTLSYTNAPPLDPNWNADASLVPNALFCSWGTGGFQNPSDLTNFVNGFNSSGYKIDGVQFDESFIASRSNGVCGGCLNTNWPFSFTNMVNYLHANGLKSVFWISRYQMTTNYTNIYNPGLGTNVYVGSYTPALLASDVQTIHGWGADGIAVDAVNYDAVNTYNQAIEYSAPITIFTTVEGWQTNGAPNPEAGSGINMTPFYIDYSGIDKRSLVEAVVNCTEFGGNDFLTCNPPDGPYTNQVQAELQMESMVFTHTNISTWVRPGHQLNACHMDVYNTTNWLATNAMSLIAMESYNFFISGFYGNGPNATAPVMQIFTNATWRAIWKDPLVKMALPVANGVWVKRLSAPNTYAVCLWNNSTNAALNINIPLTQIAPEFTGFVTVEDVMNQTMYSTNITNFTYNSLPPMATRMFLFNGKNQNFVYVYTPPAGQVLTNTLVAGYWLGEGSGVTNYDRTTNGAYALNGNVSWTTRGSSNALSVTASSYVYVAPNSSPNSGWNAVAAQPKTVAEWVYMTNNQAYAGLAAKDSFSGGWELRTFYTNLCVTLPSVGDYYATASVIPLNAWFHAAMVYNGSNSIAFYTNGVFCQSVATSAEVLDTNDIPRIASVKNGASPLTGAVQDLRIYLGAMTATDIGNIYSNVPSSTGTNGYWTCYPITFHVTNGVPYLTTP